MTFTSAKFLIFVIAVVATMNAFPRGRAREWVLLLANCLFLWAAVDHVNELLPWLSFVLVGYAAVELLRRNDRPWLLWLALTLVIGTFAVLKKYAFVPHSAQLTLTYSVLGLSYVLFRIVHLMVDAAQGELTSRIPALGYFNYVANFLTLTAGPIQRFQELEETQHDARLLDQAQVQQALRRIVHGFVKLAVISSAFSYLFDMLSGRTFGSLAGHASRGDVSLWYAAAASCFTVHLYANFAGYMDIVIGVGGLIGQRLPENFQQAFAARNFLDFWARWHITLSRWFRTYVFNPLLRVLATRITSRRLAPYLAVLAFFVTFLLMGAWHGATSVFVVYGLLMGLGASINKLWQVGLTKLLGKRAYQAFCDRPVAVQISRGLTTAFFALALTCLWTDLGQLTAIYVRLGVVGGLGTYLGLSASAAVMLAVADRIRSAALSLPSPTASPSPVTWARDFTLAAEVLLILGVSSFFHKAPEFVYRAF